MASNIFNSKPFQTVAHCDVNDPKFATNDAEKKLVRLTQKVIQHLCSSELGKGESKQLSEFVEKIQLIDKQLIESGRGLELKVNAHTLKVLEGLRTGLDPSHQKIAQDEFVLFLSVIENCELDDPLNRMAQVAEFLDQQLLPALKNVQNRRELLALEPLVNDCVAFLERLKKEPIVHGAG